MEIVQFWAEVAANGYEWTRASLWQAPWLRTEAPAEEGVFLTERAGGRAEGKQYDPLRDRKYAGLFRQFADVPPTREGVQAFANQYGLLGCGPLLLLAPGRVRQGETLDTWQAEITAMHRVLTLWNLLERGNEEGLRRYIRWEKDGKVVYESQSKEWTLDGFSFRSPDVVQPALTFIALEVNKRLSPSVVMEPEQEPPTCRVTPSLALLTGNRLQIRITPDNLLGALWWQCAQAIDGHRSYRRCDQCGTWFEVAPQAEKRNRLFCSDACRVKAYRLRQEEARKLHSQKVSLKEIAKRLGTDTTTAKGWIKRKEA
jgi:hypothetical protein